MHKQVLIYNHSGKVQKNIEMRKTKNFFQTIQKNWMINYQRNYKKLLWQWNNLFFKVKFYV